LVPTTGHFPRVGDHEDGRRSSDLSQSLDITQRYWQRPSLSGVECDQQLRDHVVLAVAGALEAATARCSLS